MAIRRDKSDPHADFWYVMRIGLVIALVLFCILPFFLNN